MPTFDVLIRGGRVVDGTGNPWFRADVAIERGRIAEVGQLDGAAGREVIDARDMVVSPGFIDAHSHSDMTLLVNPRADSKIRQGVTTEINGLCGFSGGPVPPRLGEFVIGASMVGFTCAIARDVDFTWKTLGEYLDRLRQAGLPLNFGTYAGHMNLRVSVMGIAPRPATADEIAAMQRLLEKALGDGALGLSVALDKVTAKHAVTQEVIDLCRVAAHHGGAYAQHQRHWGDRSHESTVEGVNVARGARLPVILSHHIPPPELWPKDLRLIEQARDDGFEIYLDTIAYTYGSMGLHSMLPEWCVTDSIDHILTALRDPGGRAAIKKDVSEERVMGLAKNTLLVAPRNPGLIGKTFEEIAAIRGKDLVDVALDLMVEEEMVVKSLGFGWPEDWIVPVLQYPHSFVESDGGSLAREGTLRMRADARGFGTFPRLLGHFVREKKVLPLEQAIRKITSLPAQAAGIKDRGLLRKGMHADLVVFDPVRVRERATPLEPAEYPEGIEHVLVNGVFAVRAGETTGNLAGQVVRH